MWNLIGKKIKFKRFRNYEIYYALNLFYNIQILLNCSYLQSTLPVTQKESLKSR